MTAVGIDACRAGWIAATWDGREGRFLFLRTVDQLTEWVTDAEAVGIDIPIGIPTDTARESDRLARRFLKRRGSSIFPTPVRAALEAVDYAAASVAAVAATGVGISKQAYNLAAKILEVEAWLPSAPCGVWEVSPELSFAVLLGAPAASSKKTWAGMAQRRRALEDAGFDLEVVPDEVGRMAAVDDVLDAAAAAWSALRILEGTAMSLPDPPPVDADGRVLAIWA